MSELRERMEDQTIPYLACLSGCSREDARSITAHWQTCTDGTKPHPDPLAKHWAQKIEQAAPELERLNQAGGGIFVTVNATDGRGRTKEHIVSIRGWHGDMDAKDAVESLDVARLPLAPTMIVRTPGGWHLYWLAQKPIPCQGLDDTARAHEADLKAIQHQLKAFGADRNAAEIARVLRLPGFFHRKAEPRMVELLKVDGPRFTQEQIRNAFPVAVHKPETLRCPGGYSLDRAAVLRRAERYAATLPGGIQGQGGSVTTFNAALKLAIKFDLFEDELVDLLERVHNPRCVPPWSPGELRHKAADAWRAAQASPDRGAALREVS